MPGILAPPRGCSPASLGILAVLSFAVAALALAPALNRDHGIPDMSKMTEAHGRVVSVSKNDKSSVRFRLHGRAETFAYLIGARGSGVVVSALIEAGDRKVAVLFNPTPIAPPFSSDYHEVWQLAIDGKSVRTSAETMEGRRANNALSRWLCASFFLSGLYLSLIAWRANAQRRDPFAMRF